MKSVTKAIKHYLKVEKDIVAVDFVGIRIIEAASRKFCVIMEKDMKYFIASVPSLPGCFTQAETTNGLIKNIREATELYLEVKKDNEKVDFVGVQFVEV
ncbi:MAG: type II toxin-antitoxin system HicB family antitoxin [Candidatus Aenigmarchaeota archaeon]|nr:type II toxin-antitoxin system HicB family antitoxin [Candidatus Aenigmarchaeota archaeon]